jgi:hypothetical protein
LELREKEETLSSSNNTEVHVNCPKEPTRPQTNSSKKNHLVRNRVAKDRFKTEFQKKFKRFQFRCKINERNGLSNLPAGQSEPAPTNAPEGMNGGWTGNTFPLSCCIADKTLDTKELYVKSRD